MGWCIREVQLPRLKLGVPSVWVELHMVLMTGFTPVYFKKSTRTYERVAVLSHTSTYSVPIILHAVGTFGYLIFTTGR